MITSISIENFKGIGKRITIPLKPITLLFGPNSAGKSTILHAIHYAREVLKHSNLDADRTESGWPFIDLGGFHTFVHNHAASSAVTIGFELRRTDRSSFLIPQLGQWQAYEGVAGKVSARMMEVERAEVAFSVQWSPWMNRAYIARYTVAIDGIPIATVEAEADKLGSKLTHLNLKHPLFAPVGEDEDNDEADTVAALWRQVPKEIIDDENSRAWPLLEHGALPDLDDELIFSRISADGTNSEIDATRYLAALNLLSWMIVGPGQLLRDELSSMTYLGPLRHTPPRGFQPPRSRDAGRWSTGLAAWDMLKSAPASFIDRVSEWLEDRLGTGYRLQRYSFIEAGSEVAAFIKHAAERAVDSDERNWPELARNWQALLELVRDLPEQSRLLLLDVRRQIEIEPEDVGEGIAQVVPVVVAILSTETRLILVEQPELHVHPRIQVGLGDLLIERMNFNKPSEDDPEGDEAVMLLETHSEHLMLRLLRRVRETAEGKFSGPDQRLLRLMPDELGVLYIEQAGDGVRIRELRVDETGEFLDKWPQGFFEERGEELFA